MFANASYGDDQYISKFLSIQISFRVNVKAFIFIISIQVNSFMTEMSFPQ